MTKEQIKEITNKAHQPCLVGIRGFDEDIQQYTCKFLNGDNCSCYKDYKAALDMAKETPNAQVSNTTEADSSNETGNKILSSQSAEDWKEKVEKAVIKYCYDFAWHYGRFYHLEGAEKIKAAIKERFQLPEEWIVERGNIDEIRNKFYGEWLNKPMDGVDIDQIFEWFVKHLYLSPAQVAKPPQPSVEALAEQIAKNWDVYYTREGEPQNNVISAMVEMHQAASQPISAEDWKEKVEVEAKNFSEGWGENDDEKSFIAGAEWALQYLQQQQKKEALDFINKVKYPNHYMGIPDNATKEDLLFIIAGLEEGCEQWKAEYENLKAQSLQQPPQEKIKRK